MIDAILQVDVTRKTSVGALSLRERAGVRE
jgi:hypothetical protein